MSKVLWLLWQETLDNRRWKRILALLCLLVSSIDFVGLEKVVQLHSHNPVSEVTVYLTLLFVYSTIASYRVLLSFQC